MLPPDSRVVLLDQLRPPVGYRLHSGVATTFTLDLTAALVPPLAFASLNLREATDPIAALEAIRECTDRLDIFCQAGQIVVPSQASDLMTFLEPMVHAVTAPRAGFLFHPKIWFLRYESDVEPDTFRLLCLSRNLTPSHAWDAAVTLDGVDSGERHAVNEPLSALLRHLPRLTAHALPASRSERIEGLADTAMRVQWQLPEHASDLAFHALGVPGVDARPDFSGYRHLVVTPFCDVEGLDTVTSAAKRDVSLISRAEQLERLPLDVVVQRWSPYILDPSAGLSLDEEPTEQSVRAASTELDGLHAKIVIAERNNQESHVFLGSANATHAAFNGNVEFLVELTSRASRLGVKAFIGDDAPFRTMLITYSPDGDAVLDPEQEERDELQRVLRRLASQRFELTVEHRAGTHRLTATSDGPLSFDPELRVTLSLLTMPGHACELHRGSSAEATFANVVDIGDITPFIVLRIESRSGVHASTIVHARLVNDPPGRLDAVLARQIDSPEKFLRFVALLLGMGSDANVWALAQGHGETGAFEFSNSSASGLLESLLAALVDGRDALDSLHDLVQRLSRTEKGRAALPEGFLDVWERVRDASLLLGGGES